MIGRRSLIGAVAAATLGPPLARADGSADASRTLEYLRRLRAGLLAAGGGAFDRDAEADLLELHNAARDREALAPLKFSPALSWAARAHAADLVRRGYFAESGSACCAAVSWGPQEKTSLLRTTAGARQGRASS